MARNGGNSDDVSHFAVNSSKRKTTSVAIATGSVVMAAIPVSGTVPMVTSTALTDGGGR